MSRITPGKLKGMKAVSDEKGIIRAAAMDQRGSLLKSIAKERGVEKSQVSDADMAQFKTLVTKVLTRHASAILLDPEYGLDAAKARDKKAGLLLAYEKTGYDQAQPGRLPDLIPDWTVRKTIEAGGDCVKVLLYYTPDEKPEINDIKHAFVERIGAECRALDVPFFLEFVGYDPQGGNEKGVEFAKQKPRIVAESMREFSKPEYGVDVLKVEIPVNTAFVEGTQAFKKAEVAQTKSQALEAFRQAASATTKPFIYLSAGVSDAVFRENLELAGEAGVEFNGVLCGRATWKEGIPVYAKQGAAAFEKWLEGEGVRNIQALNQVLDKTAKPWFKKAGLETVSV
ncbi:MAG: tagatose-bisphosphate aldolase [Candidatus Omnitrophica bacterium CG11_big_fil_rev_8_21_14_0_20_64_10]|nr:MAG: tagatose-bisphosphate aldolase [Candidatus Omnitrophica bacterium CG11_big_fil_rev_8_21_14_0_20_64_10]